jgi:hypothetical protein
MWLSYRFKGNSRPQQFYLNPETKRLERGVLPLDVPFVSLPFFGPQQEFRGVVGVPLGAFIFVIHTPTGTTTRSGHVAAGRWDAYLVEPVGRTAWVTELPIANIRGALAAVLNSRFFLNYNRFIVDPDVTDEIQKFEPGERWSEYNAYY